MAIISEKISPLTQELQDAQAGMEEWQRRLDQGKPIKAIRYDSRTPLPEAIRQSQDQK